MTCITSYTGTWAAPVVLANDIEGDPSVHSLPAPVRDDRLLPSWAPSFRTAP